LHLDQPFAQKPPGQPFAPLLFDALLATPLKGRPGSLEALYVVHFADLANPHRFLNGGVVVLETLCVFGGDSGYYYTGSYKVNGKALEVSATITQHNPGWNVWGGLRSSTSSSPDTSARTVH
jgi:hypothetical protein